MIVKRPWLVRRGGADRARDPHRADPPHPVRAVEHRVPGDVEPGLQDAADPDRRRRRHRRDLTRSCCWPTTRTTPWRSPRPQRKVDGIRLSAAYAPGTDGRTAIDVIPHDETVNSSSVKVVDAVTAATKDAAGLHRDGRAGRDDRRLPARGLRQVPLRHRADRAHHVPAADADLPLDPAAAQGGRPQPDQPGRRARSGDLVLAGGQRLAARSSASRPPVR